VWERADKVTREKLGFSILAVVRDNPKELTANGVTYRHPEGLLNLTQFTQVALATVAFAQTARLREAGAEVLGVASIFTYGMQKGLDRMREANVTNYSLSNLDALVEVAAEEGYIKPEDKARLIAFRNNPSDESWMQ